MKKFRIPCIVITIMLAGLVVYTTVAAQQSKEKTSGAKVHVAIFDSRALAIAYYRSEPFKRQINEMKAECEKAKAQGDEKRVKDLETEGPALQELAHKQGFSTWPVDNILENIKEKIPEIAKEANVDIIISKWAITYQRSEIEFVDVTDLMVRLFNPDEETLKIVKEIHKHDPIPLEEIEGHQWK